METIKSYTDLEQSKKLAEILSIESADMIYPHFIRMGADTYDAIPVVVEVGDVDYPYDHPCWSLTALLSVLPKIIKLADGVITPFIGRVDNRDYRYAYFDGEWNCNMQTFGNNPIDACVEMILKLRELNLL